MHRPLSRGGDGADAGLAASFADDLIQPFRVDGLDLLGRLVRTGAAVDEILARHGYPDPVSTLLGEALALNAALAAALKFDGTFTTQIQGDGPIRLLIADYRTDGAMRGYAGFDGAAVAARANGAGAGAAGDASLFGAGHLAFTVDRGPDKDRYQGLVPLEGPTLAGIAQTYLTRSEQLRAAVAVAARRVASENGGAPAWRAGCLLAQQMPRSDGRAGDEGERWALWREARTRLRRLRPDDLADPLAVAPALIGPLFPDHDVRLHAPRGLRFECRCSEERAGHVIRSIPPAERAELMVRDRLEVSCDYCGALYLFDIDGAPIAEA